MLISFENFEGVHCQASITKEEQPYRLDISRNHIFVPDRCNLCGYVFEPGNLEFTLFEDNKPIGTICPECSSPKVAASRAREHAEFLRRGADELENNALEVEQLPTSIFPTVEEIARVEQEAKAYWEEFAAGSDKEESRPVAVHNDDPDFPF